MTGLEIDRCQLVDEPLGQRMPGPGAADDDGGTVADEIDGVANVEDGGHGI